VRAGGAAAVWDHGRAVQVDPIKPALKAPGAKRLELIYDGPLSNFAFDFNLRRYITLQDGGAGAGGGGGGGGGSGGDGKDGGVSDVDFKVGVMAVLAASALSAGPCMTVSLIAQLELLCT